MQNYLDFIHHLQHKLKDKMSHLYSCTFGFNLASNIASKVVVAKVVRCKDGWASVDCSWRVSAWLPFLVLSILGL